MATTLLLLICGPGYQAPPRSSAFVGGGSSFSYSQLRRQRQGVRSGARMQLGASGFGGHWLPVTADMEKVNASSNSTVLPLFPQRTIRWPGDDVELKVSDLSQQKLYQDLLLNGGREVVAPVMLPANNDGDPDRLRVMATVLYLEELKDVSEESGGQVKYIAKHTAAGRVRLKKILNPAALLNSDPQSQEYLLAEVEHLTDDELANPTSPKEEDVLETAKELAETWEELRLLSERIEEPRLQSERLIRDRAEKATTWQLADLWQQLQLSVITHRERVRVVGQVREWIEAAQREGVLPQQLPQKLDVAKIGMPGALVEEFMRTQNPQGGIQLGAEFWEPYLEILDAPDPDVRAKLLVKMAQDEVKTTRARVTLREIIG